MKRPLIAVLSAASMLSVAACMPGSPSDADIVEVTRAQMVATAPDDAARELAETIEISPKGMCNNIDDTYACMVDVEGPNGDAQTFVSVLKKTEDGEWVAAE